MSNKKSIPIQMFRALILLQAFGLQLMLTNVSMAQATQPSSSGASPNFRRASVQGAIGEAGNLYLIPEGVYFHPLYNDVNGATDKLLTTSLKSGLLQTLQDSPVSFEVVTFWRLLTPAVKSAFLEPNLPKPVGRYADWMELKVAASLSMDREDYSIKQQLTAGLNHIGNKGGKQLHRWVHKVTHNTLENLEYTDQPEGYFLMVGYELSAYENIFRGDHARVDQQLAFEANGSKAMVEAGLRHNTIFIIRKPWWEMGLEVRMIRQIRSDIYDDIRPFRFEAAFGNLLYKYFTPTVKYVSPYLVGDNIGQTYFDVLHFNYPL